MKLFLEDEIVFEQNGVNENQLGAQTANVEQSKQLNLSFIKMKLKIVNEPFVKLSYIEIKNVEKMDMF